MIQRSQTRAQLAAWLDGSKTPEQVWEWALDAQEQAQTKGFEDALVQDVVDVLAAIPVDLILAEDAEIMLYGLDNPADEADLAQNLLWNHLDSIDVESRRRNLADDPFYGPYCSPVT